jgi:hypothetical protein
MPLLRLRIFRKRGANLQIAAQIWKTPRKFRGQNNSPALPFHRSESEEVSPKETFVLRKVTESSVGALYERPILLESKK